MSRYLFLQGNATPFWAVLQRRLIAAGHLTFGIHLTGADRAFSRSPNFASYRGSVARWPDWLARWIESWRPDAIVLFGRYRPHHLTAITLARRRGIGVWIFDEGYWRPGFVTCEGPSADAILPQDARALVALAARCPDPPSNPIPPGRFAERAAFDVSYHLVRLATHPLYPFYQPHHAVDPFIEYAAYVPNLLMGPARCRRGRAVLERMRARPAFLFPMQLEGDFQLRMRSPFAGNLDALALVLDSFARAAPPEAMLAVKSHPLDPGLRNWAQEIGAMARQVGLGGRVVFFHTDQLDCAVQACAGVVTINSTVGTLGLALGKPVLALGEALYARPGLAQSGGEMDRFWTHPDAPDAALVEAFRRVLAAMFLVPGDFFSREGRDVAAAAAVLRMTGQGLHF